MSLKIKFVSLVVALFGVFSSCALSAADAPVATTDKAPATPAKAEAKAEEAKTITIEADDAKLKELIDKVAEQSKKKIIVESTVKGTVAHLSVKNVTAEAALGAICKSGKCEWRKVYLPADSKLIEQPERLASTVRLVTAMGFPEMLISGSSNGKLVAHYTQEKTVKSVQDVAIKDPALAEVYVVTNDAAVAEKDKDAGDKSKSEKLQEYVQKQKEMMDEFMKMTPEEQERAMLEGINQFENMDPGYMASMMRTMSKMDPAVFARMQSRGTDMLLTMSQEDRRAMIKMSIQSQKFVNPEVQKMLQEDAKAVMEEMQREQGQGGNQPNP